MQAINEMQDEYSIMCHEHRDLLAKTKRLRFAQYGKHDTPFQDALVRAEERAVDNAPKIEPEFGDRMNSRGMARLNGIVIPGLPVALTVPEREADRELLCMIKGRAKPLIVFDVSTWLWVAAVSIPVRVLR